VCICGNSNCQIPYGFCHCGCEEMAPIATKTSNKQRAVKGRPRCYIYRHYHTARAQIVQPDNPSVHLIPLTRGQVAIVSAHRYPRLAKFHYAAQWNTHTKTYYAQRRVKRADGTWGTVSMQADIMEPPPGMVVDHINRRQTLDNRDENLRNVTKYGNAQNCTHFRSKTTATGVRGVHPDRQRPGWFKVCITANGRKIDLGRVKDPHRGGEIYRRAVAKLHISRGPDE
jgi:hypothetical protein